MTDIPKKYEHVKVKKLGGSRVSVEGEIATHVFEEALAETTERLRQNFEAPGFRKGHVPEKLFLESVSHGHLLEEAAETALRKVYPEIIKDLELKPITSPQISITKLAPKNPMGFKAEFAVRPEGKLPDYKKIARQSFEVKLPIELRDEEVDTFIKQLLEMEAKIRQKTKGESPETPPELTDEFVKQLGPFENVSDFKTKIKEDMLSQKKVEAARERRETFAKTLIASSPLEIPAEITDEEFEVSFNRILEDLKEANLTLEAYTSKLNKTEEAFRKEKRQQIEDQIKLRFLLEDIAEVERIRPEEDEVLAEIARLKKDYPQNEINHEQLRSYVDLLLRNEKVLKFLEGLGSES